MPNISLPTPGVTPNWGATLNTAITAVNEATDGKAATVHGHALTDANITGVLPIAQVPTGSTSTTVALGNHSHAASAISSGVIAPARMGTGTPDATTFLRGDGVWVVPPTGSGGGTVSAVYSSTSTTSTAIGTGSKTFALATPTDLVVGMVVHVSYTTTPTSYMVGNITAISSTSITVNVTSVNGSGTFAAWTIVLSGQRGPTGSTGSAGTITSATATALAAGETPTVTLGGTTTARTFTFGIPAGAAGTNGTNGADGESVTVTFVEAANWPPALDLNPRHIYVRMA